LQNVRTFIQRQAEEGRRVVLVTVRKCDLIFAISDCFSHPRAVELLFP
jgi:hypothetical protein